MNRTVPQATTEEIQLYRSTLYSLLRSTAEIKIRTLEGTHTGMNSLMHPGAREAIPDTSAFIYSAMRLPGCILDTRLVILGQNASVFQQGGYPNVEEWQPVSARARRRRCFYNGTDTLACYIASRSDIEDVVPALTAYQIEWNKMHLLFQQWPDDVDLSAIENDEKALVLLSDTLEIPIDDIDRLRTIWRGNFTSTLRRIQQKEISFSIRLLGGSLTQYMRATHEWFENIQNKFSAVITRPVYFVSSNTHSIANILTGFALRQEKELINFIETARDPDLQSKWDDIQIHHVRASKENFLYYTLKKYQATPEGTASIYDQLNDEAAHGIIRIPSEHTFDIEAQIFDLRLLDKDRMDQRLAEELDLSFLPKSDAVILNIDYPLGLAAYNILSTISIHTNLRGIYSMGKSASLNASRGDVIIPNVCQDEHSHNTYLFNNIFSAVNVVPYLRYGSVLDNQKAICVLGTFLQNARLMDVFFDESFSDVEMELGNFCSAYYQAIRPKRYPVDEIVNLQGAELDFGILHYVSDTPMSKGKNLGAGTLSYFGMDSTYACSIAIMKRIFEQESRRI